MSLEYHYKCNNPQCETEFATYQSIKEDVLTHCESCGLETLARVLYPFNLTVKDVKTLGQLMDRNTSRMGHYELQEKGEAARPKRRPYSGAHSDKVIEAKPAAPIIDLKKLNTPEKMDRYIHTGKMPL